MGYSMPGPGSPHGIYRYNKESKRWEILRREGEPFRLGELGDGIYVVYFDNLYCPACRVQDHHFYKLFVRYGNAADIHFVVVVCNWFAGNCDSKAASGSFEEFEVSSSPTIIVAKVNGKEVKEERLEGVRTDSVIEYYIKNFRST
ncbi:MAG: thioredoxin family protein [Acidilobaceae archaeon]|nr:thioredoxin family protein [Acidilobaceae archaeon]